jgi:iron complex transport system substrate-binding protein
MKEKITLSLLLLAAMSFAASPRIVTDVAGRTVTLPDKIEMVLAPGHCASIVGAFAAEKIPGGLVRGKASQQFVPEVWWNTDTTQRGPGGPPPGAGAPPKGAMGPGGGPGGPPGNDSLRMVHMKETILQKHVNLLFQENNSSKSVAEADRMQRELGIPVVLLDLSIPHYREDFELLGNVFEKPQRTQALVGFVSKYLDLIEKQVKAIPTSERVRVYYAEGGDGLRTEPEGSAHTEALEFAGGINVADLPAGASLEKSVEVTVSEVQKMTPALILVATPGSENLEAYSHILRDPSWKKIPAVKKGTVYQIPAQPFSWFDRPPGANRMIGIVWLAHLLYPERFTYDMVATTQEFFQVFYETSISKEQAEALLLTQPTPRPSVKKK